MYPTNSYSIRQATEADAATLRHLADLDGQKPFAAISVFDVRVVADPFKQTAVVTQLLRMRLAALRAHSSTPSLPERLRAAMRPFVARTTEA